MQGCLKQLCGNSAVGNPEAVAQLIAEKMAAMNISPSQNSCDDSLALSAPKQVTATEAQVAVRSEALDFTSGLIVAPALYDTSSSISSIPLARSDWNHGSTTIAERVRQIKAEYLLWY